MRAVPSLWRVRLMLAVGTVVKIGGIALAALVTEGNVHSHASAAEQGGILSICFTERGFESIARRAGMLPVDCKSDPLIKVIVTTTTLSAGECGYVWLVFKLEGAKEETIRYASQRFCIDAKTKNVAGTINLKLAELKNANAFSLEEHLANIARHTE